MWSGINFNVAEVTSQAISLVNTFMPLVYLIGGVTLFALIMLVIIALAKKSVG